MKLFLSLMLILMSFMMFFFKHPLSMGLMILIQTLMICMLSGLMNKTYWFSYILFLTFLGGLLVLFIYVSSIASNELFKTSFKMKIIFFTNFTFILAMSIYFYYNLNQMNFFFNSEMNNFLEEFMFFNNENKINLTKLYSSQTYMLMLTLIIYLFITLLAVVKITNIFYGPLRLMN